MSKKIKKKYMLVIADDITGALDTGVQFASKGIDTKIIINIDDFFCKNIESQVLVIDAETRHMDKEEAYNNIYKIVKRAKEIGYSIIYKKTDSALRGNIGSELEALLNASNKQILPFIPAYPKMNRVTKQGFHYINKIPVAQTEFGKDLFEPVKSSNIAEIIGYQSSVETKSINVDYVDYNEILDYSDKAIAIFDAQTDDDMLKIAKFLRTNNLLSIMAGCAGFAAVLSEALKTSNSKKPLVYLPNNFFMICGSLNPITKKQIEVAKTLSFEVFTLNYKQLLNISIWNTEEGINLIDCIKRALKDAKPVIVDTEDTNELYTYINTCKHSNHHYLDRAKIRLLIVEILGELAKRVLSEVPNTLLMITGGDTLLGFLKQINCTELDPIEEISPGIVLSKMFIKGRTQYLISKSGGFGEQDLLQEILINIRNRRDYSEQS